MHVFLKRTLLLLALSMMNSQCALHSNIATTASQSKTPCTLRITTKPDHVKVYLDDRYFASSYVLRHAPKKARAGWHRLSFFAAGYFEHDMLVELIPGVTTVEVTLREIPKNRSIRRE